MEWREEWLVEDQEKQEESYIFYVFDFYFLLWFKNGSKVNFLKQLGTNECFLASSF